MGPARIYPWRKMHRSRAPSIAPGTFFAVQPWADCITNMPGFNLRQAQVFGDLFVRAPVDDRQKQARAALWLELIEHGPQRHAVRDAGRGVRDGLFPLADG